MILENQKIFVTGAAGFIGSGTVQRLLTENVEVIGIDNMNDYYNPLLKQKRIEIIKEIDKKKSFKFLRVNLEDTKKIDQIFQEFKPNIVINLAAQAGVRHLVVRSMEVIKLFLLMKPILLIIP